MKEGIRWVLMRLAAWGALALTCVLLVPLGLLLVLLRGAWELAYRCKGVVDRIRAPKRVEPANSPQEQDREENIDAS